MKTLHYFTACAISILMTISASAQFMESKQPLSSSGSSVSIAQDRGFTSLYFSFGPNKTSVKSEELTSNMLFTGDNKLNTLAAGITHAFGVAGPNIPLLLEPGFFIDWTFASYSVDESAVSLNMLDIKVPLNLLGCFNASPNFAVMPYAGVHAKYYPFGKMNVLTVYKESTHTDSQSLFPDYVNNFIVGYQAGIRASFSWFIIGLGYECGFTDFIKLGGISNKQSRIDLSIGFRF